MRLSVVRAALLALLFLALPAAARAQTPRHTTAGDWSVEVTMGTTDATFTFDFRRGDEDLVVSWEMTYDAGDIGSFTTNDPRMEQVGFDRWLHDERDAYLASPRSFRDRALLRLAQLRANVERAVREGTLSVRDDPRGPACIAFRSTPQGEGAFDTCVHRRLTPAESRALLAAMHAEIARSVALVRANYAIWFSAIHALLSAPAAAPH